MRELITFGLMLFTLSVVLFTFVIEDTREISETQNFINEINETYTNNNSTEEIEMDRKIMERQKAINEQY